MHDGLHFLQAYWTPECFEAYAKKYPNTKVHKLRDFFIQIDSWTLELVGLGANEPSFNSYLNLEVRFILHKVTLLKPYKVKLDRF